MSATSSTFFGAPLRAQVKYRAPDLGQGEQREEKAQDRQEHEADRLPRASVRRMSASLDSSLHARNPLPPS